MNEYAEQKETCMKEKKAATIWEIQQKERN